MSGRSQSFTQSVYENIKEPSIFQCITPFVAFLAWICSLVANFTCEFMTLDVTVGGSAYFLGFGMWSYQGWSYLVQSGNIYYSQTCFQYSDTVDPDAKWKSAQAFSIIAVIVGGLAACFNCCVICTPNPSRGYQCFALLYLFACLSQGLTFLFVQSDACLNNPIFNLELDNVTVLGVSCNLSWGANTSIAATVLWFVSACMMCCMGFKESKSSAAGGDSADVDEEPAEEAPEEALEDAAKE